MQNDNESNSTEDESLVKPMPTKNLRFFGDTDMESNDSLRKDTSSKVRPGLSARERARSQSNRDLHNIPKESQVKDSYRNNHVSMLNISEASEREAKIPRNSSKPPMSPGNRYVDMVKKRDNKSTRKNEINSVESSTEGDSSQQSQRSVVYLHAATGKVRFREEKGLENVANTIDITHIVTTCTKRQRYMSEIIYQSR